MVTQVPEKPVETKDEEICKLAEVEELSTPEGNRRSKSGWVYPFAFAVGIIVGTLTSAPLLAGVLAAGAVFIIWKAL